MDQSKIDFLPKMIPPAGWALANIISLSTGEENDSVDPGGFHQGLDSVLYVGVVNTLAESFLSRLENIHRDKENQDRQSEVETHEKPTYTALCEVEMGSFKISYLDMFRPISQQWHLTDLLAIMEKAGHIQGSETLTPKKLEHVGNLELLDIVHLYAYMLRIFSFMNPTVGSLPILNMLSFTPGFLVNLWRALETYLFPVDGHSAPDHYDCFSKISGNGKKDGAFEKKQKHSNNDGVNKWVSVLHKITGKSQGIDYTSLSDNEPKPGPVDEDSSDDWDIEPVRHGPQGISRDMSCMLHLFCASYSHLLLILDDIEFYEKQVNWFRLFFFLSFSVFSMFV